MDAYQRWIDEHLELMERYPDCFVAIDPTRGDEGLVVHEVDEATFLNQISALYTSDPSARERLMLTHTSAY